MMDNGSASYLPDTWRDNIAMQGYMSKIKAREVNPIDHDRKVQFWSDIISSYCSSQGTAVITVEVLKRALRRGDQIPASLSTVIDYLQSNGSVVTLDEWNEKHSTWLGWGLSKTSSWLFGKRISPESSKFVHLPTLVEQSKKTFQFYLDNFKSEVDCSGEVISYGEFYDRAVGIFKTKENFDLILEYMAEQGDITIGQSSSGDKILKFRDMNNRGPVKFTAADASVHDIRKAMSKLEREIGILEKKAAKLDLDCRAAIRSKEKTKAAMFLRQKKRVEKDISDKDGQMQGLLNMLHQLSSTKFNKEILDAYKMGNEAFKSNLSQHGLSPDKIDKTMDEITSTLEDYREVEEAMSSGFGSRSKENDEELQRELEELMAENKAAQPSPSKLPDVPSGRFGMVENQVDASLEARLKRLREAV